MSYASHVAEHAMASSIYQQASPLAKIGKCKVHYTSKYPRCVGDAEGEDFKDVFSFESYECHFVAAFLRYWYLPVSALYVANSDEFCATPTVSI